MDFWQRKQAEAEALKQVKVGDEVYYYPPTRYEVTPTLRKVERVTPAGFIDVRLYGKPGETQGLTRFKDGVEVKRGSVHFRDTIKAATPELRAEVAAATELKELRNQAKLAVDKLVQYHADHHLDAASCRELILGVDAILGSWARAHEEVARG